jgi:large subunit ribosomal protein L10
VDRKRKEELVASLHRLFDETALVVVTHYSGMTVAHMTELRAKMGEAGASFQVIKNRLTRLALEGTKFQPLNALFTGPTAIAFSADPVAAAKVAVDFAKTNRNLVVLGGALNEDQLDPDGVKALASLPSLDELRSKIVGMLSTPATRIAGVLQAPAGQLARVVGAYAETDKAA